MIQLEFPSGGGTRTARLRLASPPPAADPDGQTRLGVDLGHVALQITPLDHEVTVPVARSTGAALVADLDADLPVRRVVVIGLALPRDGETRYHHNQGGIVVTSDGQDPTLRPVRAVLSAAPKGTPAKLPTRGFPGYGPPDPAGLYGDQLPSGQIGGSAARMVLDCGASILAGRVELRFCGSQQHPEQEPAGPLDFKPITFTASAEVVHAAPPRGLHLNIGPAAAPVLAWQQDPALTGPVTVELTPILSTLLTEPDTAGGAVVDLQLTCANESKVRLDLTAELRTARHRNETEPIVLEIVGGAAALATGIPGDPPADDMSAQLTGKFGPVRRTKASPVGFATTVTTGTQITDTQYAARRFTAATLEGRPLVRVGLLGAAVAGEVVVEVRADAGGPGPAVCEAGVATLPTSAVPTWHGVELPPLHPASVPAAGCWLVVRTNRGRLFWTDNGGSDAAEPAWMISADAGQSWQVADATPPALALYVDDPRGTADLTARAGEVTTTLLRAGADAFDLVTALPTALHHPTGKVQIDSARDIHLEVVDVRVGWRAALALEGVPQ